MNSTFAPVRNSGYRLGFRSLDEQIDVASLPTEGPVPKWLTGSLLRNGPARFAVGEERYRHWFDGLAMLHRFTLAQGNVSYANRFLESPAFIAAKESGRIARSEFATNPQLSLLERARSLIAPSASHNANVNIVPYGDGYLALTETPSPVAFAGQTLATRGVLTYDDDVAGQLTTAHTHHDRDRRATFNIVVALARKSHYSIVRIEDGALRRSVIASIPVDEPAYVHAFSTTRRYVVLVEYPLVVKPLDIMLSRKPFIDNYTWKPSRGTRFHVVDKDTGVRAGVYEADAFFAFHHINAFEDGDAVVLDISAYGDAAIIGDFMLSNLVDAPAPTMARAAFRRYRLVPGRSAAELETIAPQATELPAVATAFAGRQYRYAYGVDIAPASSTIFNSLVKVDLRNGTVISWSAADAFPGEPVFVPRPDGVDEDDGALLAVVLDAAAAQSYLLVLDARTLTEIARAMVPHHIPFGFHGIFRAASSS